MAKRSKKNKNSKKYYYAFIAVVLILVIIVAIIDYNFGLGIVKWDKVFQKESKTSESYESVEVDEIGNLKITFIDVGQGDAILINFPDGKNMLVDAGENCADVLDEYLTVNGEKLVLDYVVATHTDSDHIGEMDYVYENYQVNYSYRPYVKYSGDYTFGGAFSNAGYHPKSTATYGDYLKGVENEGTPNVFFTDDSDFHVSVTAEDKQIDYSVDFIMPYAKTVEGFKDFTDSNDFSSVMIVEFAGVKIMLTGDMEKDAEKLFTEYYASNTGEVAKLDCDVLKVAHHGSATSSTMSFLNLIKPEYSVISCGVCHGTYMHPRAEALDNLTAVGSSIYRTDLQGTVTLVVTTSGEITFTTQTHEYDELLYKDAYEIEDLKDEIKNFKENL
ncbi:MAG: MBL fold metallo-hydrolase [Clostridia bacterium]|nr:MBL fold metallo-hydrolase [Clostridia bacterium]